MKLPAGKELSLDAVTKVRSVASAVGTLVLKTDLTISTADLVRVAEVVERAVTKELVKLNLTDIPGYVAPPVDPSAPKVGRPKGSGKAK